MPDILEFNPNRNLAFNPNRDRLFDAERTLLFDPRRHLSFDSGRGLPFGRHGVVFRGFVCPICGSSVTEDQPACTDCGAVFDPRPAPKGTPKPAPPPIPPPPLPPSFGRAAAPPPPPPPPRHAPQASRLPPPGRAYPPAPKRVDTVRCPFCGARLGATDAFCWNCGGRMYRPGG